MNLWDNHYRGGKPANNTRAKGSLKPGMAKELAQIVFRNSDVGRAPGINLEEGPTRQGEE